MTSCHCCVVEWLGHLITTGDDEAVVLDTVEATLEQCRAQNRQLISEMRELVCFLFCYMAVLYIGNESVPIQLAGASSLGWAFSAKIQIYTRLTALCLGQPGLADTRKVKPIWILLKQETVSGSGIS